MDAATSKNSNRGSVAAIALDEAGRFMGASVEVFKNKMATETLKVLACREAIALARDIHARRVRVASDCSNAIVSIEECSLGIYAHITMEINEAKRDFVSSPCSMSGEAQIKNPIG
jgi:hypothetical protein